MLLRSITCGYSSFSRLGYVVGMKDMSFTDQHDTQNELSPRNGLTCSRGLDQSIGRPGHRIAQNLSLTDYVVDMKRSRRDTALDGR